MKKNSNFKSRYLVATSRTMAASMARRLNRKFPGKFAPLRDPGELTIKKLSRINPDVIFFPHWSHIIPKNIYEKYECVIFHMTDVPFGRGGTPLQNLIARGKKRTKISALRCTGVIDGGPVYLKRPLSLVGRADEIYARAYVVIESMIEEFVSRRPHAKPQKGRVVMFKRRTPEDSDLRDIGDIKRVYDAIRMLDAEGYPHAFLQSNKLKFEFTQAKIEKNHVVARVKITERT